MEQRIKQWVEAHREEFLEDLKGLIAIPSVRGTPAPEAPFGREPKAALDYVLRRAAEMGFATENHANAVGTADLSALPRRLDILAHLDVVDAGEGWDSDPFAAVVREDGCLYGRGVADDKGPAMAALYAMRCVQALQLPLSGSCRMIFGTDEESGMGDLPLYYAGNAPAPATFSPDADFPVINTEKGCYRPAFSRTFAPTTALPRVTELQGGERVNVLPARASARIAGLDKAAVAPLEPVAAELGLRLSVAETADGLRLETEGKSAHASTPEEGCSGLTGLVALLCRLPLADCDSTNALHQLARLLPHGGEDGAGLGIAQADAVSGALTAAFTRFSLDDAGCRGQLDCRVPLCATAENCQAPAQQMFRAAGFAVTGSMEPGHHTPGDGDFVRCLLDCYTAVTGREGQCLSMGGSTYVHHVPGGVAFGATMPGFASHLHGANERLPVSDLLDAIQIFALAIARLCA